MQLLLMEYMPEVVLSQYIRCVNYYARRQQFMKGYNNEDSESENR